MSTVALVLIKPDVMRSFTLTRKMLFDDGAGVLEHELKELTRAGSALLSVVSAG